MTKKKLETSSPALRKPTKAERDAAHAAASQKMYERRPSRGAPEWALWELHGQLVASARLYETGEIQNQRDAVASSILAVHDYLVGRGFALAAIAPLMRPVAALVEREGRSIDALFCHREPRSGRPKNTIHEWERTGVLAALANLWLETHPDHERPQKSKLAEAARNMKGPWFKGVTGARLKTARDLVMQEAADHPAVQEAKRFSSETVDLAKRMFGDTAAWDVLIDMLNQAGVMYSAATKIEKTRPISPTDDS